MTAIGLRAVCAILFGASFAGPAVATPCGGLGDPIEYGCVYDDPKVQSRKEIEWLLRSHQDAWNAHDWGLVLHRYLKTDALRMARGGTVIRGWQEARAYYKQRFAGRERTEKLTLSNPDIRLLNGKAALAFGRWQIERGETVTRGLFTLLLRRTGDRWVIAHDHRSAE